MPLGNYKSRNIYNQSGKLLSDEDKERGYRESKDFLDSITKSDSSIHKLLAFMMYNKNYRTSNLVIMQDNADANPENNPQNNPENNIQNVKSVNEWTPNEVIEKIKDARREAGLGGIGWFEAGDRVRNFKSRMALSSQMTSELRKFYENRVISLQDASIADMASHRQAPHIQNEVLKNAAINWIAYLNSVRNEQGANLDDNHKVINPVGILRSLTENDVSAEINALNMLQVIEDTNMEEFAYTDNQTFAADFAKKYEKLKALADGQALMEYIKSKHNNKFNSRRAQLGEDENGLSNKVIEAKSKMAAEILKDYELRMRLITSPYYALFAGKDFEKLTPAKIRRMKKGVGHEALDAYLEDVISYKNSRNEAYKGVNITERLTTYVTNIQPEPEPVVKTQSEKTLDDIDNLIRTMYLDTKRASAYRKVKSVLKKYVEATDQAQKIQLLEEIASATTLYLHERTTSSYDFRKTRCENFNKLFGQYQIDLENERQAAINADRERQQAAIEAENQRIQQEQEQQAIRQQRENELRDKAKLFEDKNAERRAREAEEQLAEEEREKLAAEREAARLAREQAERERIEAERLAAEQERQRQEAEFNKAVSDAQKGAKSFMTKYAAEEAIREAERRADIRYLMFNEAMDQAIEKYESLSAHGKTAKDSKEARKAVLDFLDKYVFNVDDAINEEYDKAFLDTVPTVILVEALKAHKKDATRKIFDDGKYGEFVKKDLIDKTWYINGTHAEMTKPLTDALNKKPGQITEQDRLNAYEYSVHVLDFLSGDISHDDLLSMDLKKLSTLAGNAIKLDETSLDENETFENIPEERRKAHIDAAADIVAFFAGKDAELFKFLPTADLSNYAFDMIEHMQRAEKLKELVDSSVKAASEIKGRYDSLTAAIESKDRHNIIQSILTVTGLDQSDLDEVPTFELIPLAEAVRSNVTYKDKMISVLNEKKAPLISRDEDYYREKFLELDKKAWTKALIPEEALTKREYGYAYVKKVLGLDKVPVVALSELNDAKLYTLVSKLGVIKHLDGEDNKKAVEEIMALELNKGLVSSINNALKSKMVVEKAPMFGTDDDVNIKYAGESSGKFATQDFPDARHRKENLAKAKAKASGEEYKENANVINENPNVIIENNENKINENVINEKGKINNEKPREERWPLDNQRFLNIIGDLYKASGTTPMDVDAIMSMLISNTDILANMVNIINNKGHIDVYTEVINSLSPDERIYIEGAKPVLDAINGAINDEIIRTSKNGKAPFVLYKHVKGALSNALKNVDWNKVSEQLNKAAEKGDVEMVKKMKEATSDPFDQIGGYGLPDIFNLDAKAENDKEMLSFAQDSLRYNKDFGQGKFYHGLMNNYYTEAALKDQRNMLSFIIKGFKKNDKGTTAEMGGNYFASSLKGAGPIMQKMMQGIPEFMVVPELRNAINVVKSDLGPIDKKHVDSVIEDIKKNAGDKITVLTPTKSLGAASIAETFLCNIAGPKITTKQAVIKILRPDAKERMDRELPFIKKTAVLADDTHTTEAGFLAQLTEIEKEFDFTNEAENINQGKKKYKGKDKKVNTVELVDVPTGQNYLLMTKAEGTTLDRHMKESRDITTNALKPFEIKVSGQNTAHVMTLDNIGKTKNVFHDLNHQMKKSIVYGENVSKVAKVWTEEALYGSAWSLSNDYNFRHGDLHSGNIMVTEKDATILDYGNASMLHHEKVTEILKMMSAVTLNKPEWFVESFSVLLNKAKEEDDLKGGTIGYKEMDEKVKAKYTAELGKIFSTGTPETAGIKVMLALTTAQSMGIKLPIELQNFSQCQQRLENSLADIKQSAMETRQQIEKLERMPLDKSIKNSCDPLVIFQRAMLKKNKDNSFKFRKSAIAAKYLLDDIEPLEVGVYLSEIESLKKQYNSKGKKIEQKINEYKEKFYPQYKALQTTYLGTEYMTLDAFPKQVDVFRKQFEKAKETFKKTGKLGESFMDIAQMDTFFKVNVNPGASSGLLAGFESAENIAELCETAFRPPFNDVAFEKLMAICTVDISSISNNCKMIDNTIKYDKLKKAEQMEVMQDGMDALKAVKVSMLKKSKTISVFLDRIRDVDNLDVFEKEMKRVFNEKPEFKKAYMDYKEARLSFDKLGEKNTSKDFVEARRKILDSENKLVEGYAQYCKEIFTEKYESTKDLVSLNGLQNGSYIPDYLDVIYDVMMKYKVSTFKRLGTKYSSEFERQEKIEKAKEKAEKEAKEKAEKEVKEAKLRQEKEAKEKTKRLEKERLEKEKADKALKAKQAKEKEKQEKTKKKTKGK